MLITAECAACIAHGAAAWGCGDRAAAQVPWRASCSATADVYVRAVSGTSASVHPCQVVGVREASASGWVMDHVVVAEGLAEVELWRQEEYLWRHLHAIFLSSGASTMALLMAGG